MANWIAKMDYGRERYWAAMFVAGSLVGILHWVSNTNDLSSIRSPAVLAITLCYVIPALASVGYFFRVLVGRCSSIGISPVWAIFPFVCLVLPLLELGFVLPLVSSIFFITFSTMQGFDPSYVAYASILASSMSAFVFIVVIGILPQQR